MLRAREDPTTRFAHFINIDLQIRGEIGRSLNLIKNCTVGKLCKKCARVTCGKGAIVERFKIDVGLLRKCHAAERALAALARPRDCDNREVPSCEKQALRKEPWMRFAQRCHEGRIA